MYENLVKTIINDYNGSIKPLIISSELTGGTGNISPDRNNNPFEDWWIHPDLVDKSIYDNFIYEKVEYINGEDYMLIDIY